MATGNQRVAGPAGISYAADHMSDASTARSEEAPTQYVMGCIGKGVSLYDRITELLHERGNSWTKLAKALAISRQALIKSIRSDRVSYRLLQRVCDGIGIDPFTLFETMDPEQNLEIE